MFFYRELCGNGVYTMSDHSEVFATHYYYDKTFESDAVKILPGEYHVSSDNLLQVTVLGSCVTACIRDKRSGIGGINHFMLPDTHQTDPDSPIAVPTRYGTYAMEVLINHLMKLGAARGHLEAKIFGGASVLDGVTVSQVGARNAAFVREFLRMEKIRVVAEDLLDIFPRKVYFFPGTGRVMVRKMKAARNEALLEYERRYRQRIIQAPVAGDAELF